MRVPPRSSLRPPTQVAATQRELDIASGGVRDAIDATPYELYMRQYRMPRRGGSATAQSASATVPPLPVPAAAARGAPSAAAAIALTAASTTTAPPTASTTSAEAVWAVVGQRQNQQHAEVTDAVSAKSQTNTRQPLKPSTDIVPADTDGPAAAPAAVALAPLGPGGALPTSHPCDDGGDLDDDDDMPAGLADGSVISSATGDGDGGGGRARKERKDKKGRKEIAGKEKDKAAGLVVGDHTNPAGSKPPPPATIARGGSDGGGANEPLNDHLDFDPNSVGGAAASDWMDDWCADGLEGGSGRVRVGLRAAATREHRDAFMRRVHDRAQRGCNHLWRYLSTACCAMHACSNCRPSCVSLCRRPSWLAH